MVANATPESKIPETATLPLPVRLSRNISTRRRALGLTQAQLAERLGVDTETLSRFERGKHLPSVTTLERLASLLLTTVGELLDEQPQAADDDALAMTSWLSSLAQADRLFVRGLLKQCCDHLTTRDAENS